MTAFALAPASRCCGLHSFSIDNAPARAWFAVTVEH